MQKLQLIGAWMNVTNPRRIAIARKKLHYTQANLAALVGCTQQYISALESGTDTDCSEQIALRICKRLGVELEDAFEEKPIFTVPTKTRSKSVSKRAAA